MKVPWPSAAPATKKRLGRYEVLRLSRERNWAHSASAATHCANRVALTTASTHRKTWENTTFREVSTKTSTIFYLFHPFSWQCLDFLFAWCLTYLTLLLTWHSDFEYLHSGWSSSFLCWFNNHNSSFYAQLKIPIGFYWFHDFLLVRVQFKTNMLVNFSHPGAIFMLSDITP